MIINKLIVLRKRIHTYTQKKTFVDKVKKKSINR